LARNEKGDIVTNTKEVQGIIRNCFENLYSNKLENQEEMDKFVHIL
jgi:RNA-binding protein YlmH